MISDIVLSKGNHHFYWGCFVDLATFRILETTISFTYLMFLNKGLNRWLRPPDAKSWLIRKAPDTGKDWGWEEKGMTEDEMVGWHHWLDGRELEQTPGVGDGQGGLACCSPWGHKESDTTEWLNWLNRWPSSYCVSQDLSSVHMISGKKQSRWVI